MTIQLTGPLIEAFAGTFLSPRYDMPMPTPAFHREAWALYASDVQSASVVAPRDHAKSTALTFDFVLAEVCFRIADYVIIIGSTEVKASEQLSNISEELHTNIDLREEFGIVSFESDQKMEIIVVCDDGHRFRILARGAEQKIRGALWKGKRPNLIVGDDMEDDEQVESKDRRLKFRRWFFRAAKQALSKSGKIRVHGTILHEDSLLNRLQKNKAWSTLFYKAHTSYDDFTNLLWPERWTEEQLRLKRWEFEEDGDAAGYAQEFLNDPQDRANSYLKREQFREMSEDDHHTDKMFYVGCDFAVSKADIANKTAFVIGGKDAMNVTSVVDVRTGRWESIAETEEETGWIDELFSVQERWNPEMFFVEGGVIWRSVYPMIRNEMMRRDIFLNFQVCQPTKDKGIRGKPFQSRMKAGAIRFDKQASWYSAYEDELLKFTAGKQAKEDDQFDASAWLFSGLEGFGDLEEDDFMLPDPLEVEEKQYHNYSQEGRNVQTGY